MYFANYLLPSILLAITQLSSSLPTPQPDAAMMQSDALELATRAETAPANKPHSSSDNAAAFSGMLDQYNQLQQETEQENQEMQTAQAFWNPLESASKQDATS